MKITIEGDLYSIINCVGSKFVHVGSTALLEIKLEQKAH